MMHIIGMIGAAISAFLMGFIMQKQILQDKALKASGKLGKEYDKIDKKEDKRSDADVLKKK